MTPRLTDEQLMELALRAAASADHATSPNPMVGALVARDGQVLAVGHHARAGQPHAEVVALKAAGNEGRGADLFVTLEPCTHQGRTPPCLPRVIQAQLRRVVVAMRDPNPLVDGAGVTALRAAGLLVEEGVCEAAARRLNQFYVKRMRSGMPFVTAKFAASLDGRIATRTGESRWISSPESRLLAHRLRHQHDALLVGAGTVLRDDPQLTVRLGADDRQPLRVVVDSSLRVPTTARVFEAPKLLLATTAQASATAATARRAEGADVVVVPGHHGRVDLRALLILLAEHEVISVLAEGGATLLGSLVDEGLVDRVIAFLAPRIIGGEASLAAVGGRGADTPGTALALRDVEVDRCGTDIVVTGYCGA